MKKILSIAMTLCMVLAFIPVISISVSAATVSVASEDELRAALTNDATDTITLTSDIEVKSTITTKGKDDTIDLAGYTITYNPEDLSTTDPMIKTSAVYHQLAVTNSNTTTVDEITKLPLCGFENIATNAPLILVQDQSYISLGINNKENYINGDIYVLSTQAGQVNSVFGGYTGKLTLKGYTFNFSTRGAHFKDDVVVEGTMTVQQDWVYFEGNVTATILNSNNDNLQYYKTVTVTDTFNAKGSATYMGAVNAANSSIGGGAFKAVSDLGKAVITGGTFAKISIADGSKIHGGTFNSDVVVTGSYTIVGGKFNSTSGFTGTPSISGGQFKVDPAAYLVTDAYVTLSGDYYIVSVNTAELISSDETLNGSKYTTVQAAHDKALDGDTIKLINDVEYVNKDNYVLELTKDNITLDLNGHNITDLSDTVGNMGSASLVRANTGVATVNTFKLTSSNGKSRVDLVGSDTNSQSIIAMLNYTTSDEVAKDYTFENVEIYVHGGEGNNRTMFYTKGSSTLDNKITFNNFDMYYENKTTVAGTGNNGFNMAVKGNYEFNNCNIRANRYALNFNAADAKYTLNNVNVDCGKTVALMLSQKSDVTINGGSINISHYKSTQNIPFIVTNTNSKNSVLNINDATWTNDYAVTTSINQDITATFKNSTITGTQDTVLLSFSAGNITLDNTKVYQKHKNGRAIHVSGKTTTLNLNNGSFVGFADEVKPETAAIRIAAGSPSVNLNDCSVKGQSPLWSAVTTGKFVITKASLHTYDTYHAFAFDANSAKCITVADGSKLYTDANGKTPVDETTFVWDTTKDLLDLYVMPEQTENPLAVNVSTDVKASIRMNQVNGIRFYTTVDQEKIAALEADGATVELGTLIAPKDLLDGTELTLDLAELATPKAVNVKYQARNEDGSVKYYTDENGFSGIVGTIANIKESNTAYSATSGNITRDFVARGYVKVTKGTDEYVSYADVDLSQSGRSLKTVAAGIIGTAFYEGLASDLKAKVDAWANAVK